MTAAIAHRTSLAAALVVLWSSAAAAQAATDAWSIEEGLPQSSVNDIRQTRDGYLWLATFGGLVRFDGVRFVVFDRATSGVRSLRFRALHEDHSGVLWAGTDDGMLVRYREGRFTSFDGADGYPGGTALRIDEDRDGVLWITTVGRVIRYDRERFTTFEPGQLPHDVRPRGQRIFQTTHATVWWSRSSAGVHCLRGGRVELCVAAAALPADELTGVSIDHTGAIWIHTAGAVVRHHEGTVDRVVVEDGKPHAARDGLLFQSRDGTVWVRPPTGALDRIVNGKTERVSDLIVLSLFEDREGSIWFGSTVSGLHRVRRGIVSMFDREQGLSSNNVYTLLRDRRGAIWIGTWGGGLNRLDGGRTVAYRTVDGLPADEIAALFEDRSGRLLVGTPAGVASIEGTQVTRYPDPEGWLTGHVWDFHEDDDGTRWFATDHGVVWEHGAARGRYTVGDGLVHDMVTMLLRGRDGALWIGTSRGLSRLANGTFTNYGEREGLVGNHVRALAEVDDALWVGTYDGGLYRLSGGRLTRFTTADGLHDNGVFQLLDDGLGHFWIGSNRGIFRVARSALRDFAEGRAGKITSVVFGIADGLTTLECNGGRQPSGLQMPDGTLWIPTQGGVARIAPALLRLNPHPPPVRIEDLRIAGAAVPLSSAGVETPPDRNTFEIDYTALTFARADQARFRYRLIGLDDDWVEAGNRRTASYHRIPPGRYAFQVIAANSDGVWNLEGDRLAIVVLAPIWRQGWFLVLVGGIGLLLVVLLDRRRIGRLTREHARQQAYARQLRTVQEQEQRRISNELHDSLGQTLFLIRQRARSVRDDSSATAGAETEMDAIAGLAARAYDEMKDIAYNLRPYHLDKIGLTRTIEGMVHRVGKACGLKFTTEIEPIDDCFSADDEIHVYRIVQEGLNNVVKHARASDAAVAIQRRGRSVEIAIRDNGCGFSTDRHGMGIEGLAHFGLTNLEERARALNGSTSVQSRPGEGTTLLIRLECRHADHGR